MKISDIKIGERFRKDLGNLATLEESMKNQGQLQPVGIDGENTLVFGLRRIRAAQNMGWTEIATTVVNVTSLVEGEHDENEVRENFRISERVAIQTAVEAKVEERRGRPAKNVPDRVQIAGLAINQGEKTPNFAARKAGFSSMETARRAKTVVAKGTDELIAAVDEGTIALTPAEEIAKEPKEEQSELLQQYLQSNRNQQRSTTDELLRKSLTENPHESDRSISKRLHAGTRKIAKIRKELEDSKIIDIQTGKEYSWACIPSNAPAPKWSKAQEKTISDIWLNFKERGHQKILAMMLEGEWPHTVNSGALAQHLNPRQMAHAILYHWSCEQIAELIDRLSKSPKVKSASSA